MRVRIDSYKFLAKSCWVKTQLKASLVKTTHRPNIHYPPLITYSSYQKCHRFYIQLRTIFYFLKGSSTTGITTLH